MQSSPTTSPTTSRTPAPAPVPVPRPRLTTKSVSIPASRPETHELRELLETHLLAMQALLDEQQRTVARALRVTGESRDESSADLRTELRALADVRSPWVQAMSETRALLFVALRELIVGDNDAGLSLQIPAQPKAEPAGPPPS